MGEREVTNWSLDGVTGADCDSHVKTQGDPKDLDAQVWVETPPGDVRAVEELTWFPLVPGGPSLPG